ncbi:hypothetical protein DPMN_004646 [Dreissena polymorpha]|uniref:Uncharacterized protein n=1 Tax=Dreissena polymorpha TaxID=45954 RepID=A0A9D4RTQ9_DREPO|nr:hypothetical protein DPMN_004646 [Dreissena polymorpha]
MCNKPLFLIARLNELFPLPVAQLGVQDKEYVNPDPPAAVLKLHGMVEQHTEERHHHLCHPVLGLVVHICH